MDGNTSKHDIFAEMVTDGRASKCDIFTEKSPMEMLPRATYLQKLLQMEGLPSTTYLQKGAKGPRWNWVSPDRFSQSSGLKKISALQQERLFVANNLPPVVIWSCFFADLKSLS